MGFVSRIRGGRRVEKQLTMKQCLEVPTLRNVSSLNLRMGRKSDRKLDEPIVFRCTMCGRPRWAGKNSSIMVKLEYIFRDIRDSMVFCDSCVDVFADAIRDGPRVFNDAVHWQVRSRVARVSLVEDSLFCFKCQGRSQTHLFFKYDDLRASKESYQTMRVCSRCVVNYLIAMKETGCTKSFRYQVLKQCQGEFFVQKSTFGFPRSFGVLNGS